MATKSKSKTKEIVSEPIPSSEVDVLDIDQNILPSERRKQFVYRDVPIVDIVTGMNIRSDFSDEAMVGLVESVGIHGILEPLIVNEFGSGSSCLLVAGERRLRAAIINEMDFVPCKVYFGLSESDVFDIMLTENLLRADLNPIEEARGLKKLIEVGMKQEDLGKRIGRSQEYVANRVRLLDVPDVLQQMIISREITPSHVTEFMTYKKYGDVVFQKALELFPVIVSTFFERYDRSIPIKDMDYNVLLDAIANLAKDPKNGITESVVHSLRFEEESSKCSNCDKKYRGYCLDVSCFKSLEQQMNARHAAEKEIAKENKTERVKTPEEIAAEEKKEFRKKVADAMFSFHAISVGQMSLEDRMEIIVNYRWDREEHSLEQLKKFYPEAFGGSDVYSVKDKVAILCVLTEFQKTCGYSFDLYNLDNLVKYVNEHPDVGFPEITKQFIEKYVSKVESGNEDDNFDEEDEDDGDE